MQEPAKLEPADREVLAFIRDVPVAEVDLGDDKVEIGDKILLSSGRRDGRRRHVDRGVFERLRPFLFGNGIKYRIVGYDRVLVSLNARGVAALAG